MSDQPTDLVPQEGLSPHDDPTDPATTRAERVSPSAQRRLPGRLAPRDRWRVVSAFASGVLTFVATTGGLFVVLPWAQSSVLAGIVVGLVAPGLGAAGAIGAIVGLAGATLGPASFFGSYPSSQPLVFEAVAIPGSIAVCAASAMLSDVLSRRRRAARPWLLALTMLLLIGNLWFTTLKMNSVSGASSADGAPLPSFNTQLGGVLPSSLMRSDGALYLDIYMGIDRGAGFYAEYASVHRALGRPLASVADFRLPTLFWVWRALPNARYIVIAFLVLASAAVLSVIPLGVRTVRAPLLVPGAAALASYMLYFPVNMELFRQDEWAGALGVIALALHGVSLRAVRWRVWTSAAVMTAALAVLTRETMVFLVIAGFASAFVGVVSQRRFRALVWGVGLVGVGILYGLHVASVVPYVVSTGGVPRVGFGSLGFMLAAFHFGTTFLGSGGWVVLAFALMGLTGVVVVPGRRMRIFAVIATLAPLASFLVVGNNAWTQAANGGPQFLNYWGTCTVPLLYALAPISFILLPFASVQSLGTES